MTQQVGALFESFSRRTWASGLTVCGLFATAWVAIAHVPPDENLAGDAELRTAASSARRTLNSENEGALRSLDEAIEFVRTRREALRQVTDYTAVFAKTEFVNERLVNQTLDLKFRQQPFSVYLRGRSKRKPAREAIFVAGKNDDRLMVHEAGLKALITVNLKPDDPRLMAENRYPITEIGMARMLDIVLAIWEQEKHLSLQNVEVQHSTDSQFGSIPCEEIRVTHQERLKGLKFQSTRIAFAVETGFPVILEQYDWPAQPGETPPMVEQYLYSDIKANCGLTDADFDRENPEYSF